MNKLYCTDVYCEWVHVYLTPSIFWNSFQETEITTISQMMWTAMSSNSFAIVRFATAKLKMKTLPAGFPVDLCSTAIKFSDRHSNRSFFLRRIVDPVVDVSEIVAFPPSERLAFQGIVLMQRQMLVAVEEAFCGPSAFKRRIQCLAFLQPLSPRSCKVVSFWSDAIEKHDFLFANIVLRQ